jgi:hypothetical protein
MFFQNTITQNLTGTSFGNLSSYKEAKYEDSYFFTDLFNRPYDGYTKTISGNGFFLPFTSTLVNNISDIDLWIDGTDSSTYLRESTNSSLISGIVDKSNNRYRFIRYIDTPSVPCQTWFYSNAVDSNLSLTSIAYGDGRFIAAAKNSTFFVMTTSLTENGIRWGRTGTVPSNEYNRIVYGQTANHGKSFVAISSSSNSFIISNNSGSSWTTRTFPGTLSNWKGIAYGNNKFVVISNDRALYWLTDTPSTTFQNGNNFLVGQWNNVIFGNNMFIVMGDSDKIQTSSDGINWTTNVLPVTSNIIDGVYGYNKFILVGGRDANTVGVSSQNGINWGEIKDSIPFNFVQAGPIAITYNIKRDQYILLYDKGSSNFNATYYSLNGGETFENLPFPSLYNFNDIETGKNNFDIDLFVSVGDNNNTNIAVLSCPYLNSRPITTRQWPVTCFDYSNKNALYFTRDTALFNDSFYLSLSNNYTMYMVWKDLNAQFFTIPFGFYSVYNDLSGEFILRRDYNSESLEELPEGSIGIRNTSVGYRIENFFGTLTSNNITLWEKVSTDFIDLSANSLFINNTSLNLSSYYLTPNDTVLQGSKIGYLSGTNFNNFLLCELILFRKKLSKSESDLMSNYFSNKYCFPYYKENLTFKDEITGGPMSNVSYEDYSSLTSHITLPVQSCVTLITITLSSFETTKSNIQKIVYNCGDLNGVVESSFLSRPNNTSFINFDKNQTIQFVVVPSNTETLQSYYMYLSVFRTDSTINKIILSGTLLKCGILDLYSKNKFVDSQILNDSKELLLVTENLQRNMLYLNKVNIDIPLPALSGGEEQALINTDFEDLEEDIILLSDLLQDEVVETFRRPYFVPVPSPRTNPIRPE